MTQQNGEDIRDIFHISILVPLLTNGEIRTDVRKDRLEPEYFQSSYGKAFREQLRESLLAVVAEKIDEEVNATFKTKNLPSDTHKRNDSMSVKLYITSGDREPVIRTWPIRFSAVEKCVSEKAKNELPITALISVIDNLTAQIFEDALNIMTNIMKTTDDVWEKMREIKIKEPRYQ